MSVFDLKKYKISLKSDSKKTQGLRAGDIVRRQYFDGRNVIYSLMCVIDSGSDQVVDENNEIKEQPYFIAALLEGDPPETEEILDFMRVTNLFDLNRSGALYLTASDDQSPYMDVIDGIGRNKSLCWPESISIGEYVDPESQYNIDGANYVKSNYIKSEQDNYRICKLTKNSTSFTGPIGIRQDFYQLLENPQRVLISYKIKSSKKLENIKGSLGYTDGTRMDGEFVVYSDTNWKYKFHAITIDWSGRHLRSFKLNVNDNLANGDEVFIADFNIILLSSIANFGDASHIRVGKLNGINDPVFGKLSGYGAYLQKMYASRSANISGTLTAGDENGFASTFYAGKIHKNAFINSIQPNFLTEVEESNDLINPTGIGSVYKSSSSFTINAQTSDWLKSKVEKKYCLSFWVYSKNVCDLYVLQNGSIVGTIIIDSFEIDQWIRANVVFEIKEQETDGDPLFIGLSPAFHDEEIDGAENIFYFTSPQLEFSEYVTPYQPTDSVLNIAEDYGAWFARGGIGGTIQNPLLQLNYDGKGGIGTRSKSFLLEQDGAGYFARKNISWDDDGIITFGEGVTLNWNNIGDDAKNELSEKSIKIIGKNSISVITDSLNKAVTYSPEQVTLEVTSNGFNLSDSEVSWYSLKEDGTYQKIPGSDGDSFSVNPTGDYWLDGGSCNMKCSVLFNQKELVDTILIQKVVINGFDVVITSTGGDLYRNGVCNTILKADIYYQGMLLPEDFCIENFYYVWTRYDSDDNIIYGWPNGTIIKDNTLELNYELNGFEKVICEITLESSSFILGKSKLGQDILN